MRVVVLGASGRTGRLALEALTHAGHTAVAFGRSMPPDWAGAAILGQPQDAGALAPLVRDADAVFSCLGSSPFRAVCLPATRAVLAQRRPGLRYVVVGGSAVTLPRDAKSGMDKAMAVLMRMMGGQMLQERQAEYAALAQSDAAFTFLRPPRLTNAAPTGRWTLTFDRPASGHMARADLAAAMVAVLGRDDLVRTAPFIADTPR
ncbi:MAG: NAD(P)-dependent oxidoreductase [Paracoccaceae bacterium]